MPSPTKGSRSWASRGRSAGERRRLVIAVGGDRRRHHRQRREHRGHKGGQKTRLHQFLRSRFRLSCGVSDHLRRGRLFSLRDLPVPIRNRAVDERKRGCVRVVKRASNPGPATVSGRAWRTATREVPFPLCALAFSGCWISPNRFKGAHHIMSFADLGVSTLSWARSRSADHTAVPVQEIVIGDVLAGHDVLVQSPTGSGKTLAFGVPMVDLIEPGARATAALVLAPTRELAEPDRRRARRRRPRPQPGRRRLRRRRLRPAERRRPQGRHRRRHPRPARGPDRARRHLAQAGPRSSSSTRPTGCSTWASSPPSTGSSPRSRPSARRCSSRRPSRARRQARRRLHPRAAPPRPQAARSTEGRHRAPLRPRRLAERSWSAWSTSSATPSGGRTLVFVRTKRGADRLVKRLRSQ